jgi:hypothetical protein
MCLCCVVGLVADSRAAKGNVLELLVDFHAPLFSYMLVLVYVFAVSAKINGRCRGKAQTGDSPMIPCAGLC